MRLDKYLCKSTDLTKPEAIERIHDGKVNVNNETVTDESTQVHESNTILLNGTPLKLREFRYLLMHKPSGTICSNIDEVYPSLFNYIEIDKASELHIAGRLDADTTGLVLITDDGHWSFNITLPNKSCKKVYRVTLSRDIKDDVADKFKAGIQLQGEQKLTRPAELEVITSKEVLLTITEGKFHQVKRMFAAVGNRVVGLHREQIGEVRLDVEAGQWRYLTKAEVDSFQQGSE
ncbi:pseudouridine synthase [Vibrio sp. 10N.261.46.E12]|uniref:pseudouridine synthase n=1 Tax=unclassified Vibrio TaxID=2614977 RepID=UPI000976B052|nr:MULTISPECIES: pseudouridine synthase [unclassified Vibrio]OMO38189.1 16S rRNA pseudouridine(516) synthase [Vibrio sp. 10N.261.45.E1]PMJ21311.1 16S rRNA pseudouridine(516) synthase [Vibrio sp. 10N.286.45.B6]PML84550.1 16S rRNA pseudouridine(516) synthase [Vibrio sp. 10N.261.49.E11]PMM64427.1 16S rRNA pseudouridine(516) synthase [Vibrio sp. 10N.261.46.F12]PMM78855.1 16S rRNA pseudouridine(516) synthase [Vibrio sp. 10N.261.46.E8]